MIWRGSHPLMPCGSICSGKPLPEVSAYSPFLGMGGPRTSLLEPCGPLCHRGPHCVWSACLTPALDGFQKGGMWAGCIPVSINTCGETVGQSSRGTMSDGPRC